jgi:hypothetical protein
MKRTILLLAVVSLIAIPSFAKKEAGDVPAPVWAAEPVQLVDDDTSVKFDWEDVTEAEKYCLNICGMVLVDGLIEDEPVEDVEIEWCVCFGTSDWNEDMSASEITIPLEDLHLAIFAAIDEAIADAGIVEAEYTLEEMCAKVKGLDPHAETGKKRQNNEFSEPLDLMPHPDMD